MRFWTLFTIAVLASANAQPTKIASVGGKDVVSEFGSQPLLSDFRKKSIEKRSLQELVLPTPKLEELPRDEKPSPSNLIGIPRMDEVALLSAESRTLRWETSHGGQLALLAVTSAGASALRIGIRFEHLPPGLEIRVSDLANWLKGGKAQTLSTSLISALYGPGNSLIWTPVTSGETQIIELFANEIDSEKRDVGYVENASHLLVDPANPGRSDLVSSEKLLSCHENYRCETNPTIQLAGRAVAKIVITDSAGLSGSCSGALLNDRGSTGALWFATAAHCQITNQAIASNVQFFWYFEDGCGTGVPSSNAVTTVGAQYLLWDADIDLSFLKVVGPPPSGLRFLGWDPNPVPSGSSVFGIHHPRGTYKRVSEGSTLAPGPISFSVPGQLFHISATGVIWSFGITEPGSSGSPLMTYDGSLRGTASAGPLRGTCATPIAAYAQFSDAYPKVRNWIDPAATITFAHSASETFTVQQSAYESITKSGLLTSSSDQNWFRFTFPGAGYFQVWSTYATGATTDTFVRLYLSDGTTLVTSNDNDPTGSVGSNFNIFVRVSQPTTAYIQVTGANGSSGPYVLHSLFDPDDSDGHPGFPTVGTPLPPNGSDVGEIVSGGDVDYFIVDLPSAGVLTLQSGGSTDLVGYLFDSNLKTVDSNDDASSADRNFRISRTLQPGRYYLAIVGYDLTTRGSYSIRSTFVPAQTSQTVSAKTLGSRATVSPTATLYGGFELSSTALVYILVRGNSLGTLGITQGYLDAPRLRIYNSQGQDIVTDQGGRPGFNNCLSSISSALPVVNYYQTVRGEPVNGRDACTSQTLAPGVYTFSVTPSIPGVTSGATTSTPGSGEVLFEVTLGGGGGSIAKTLGSRATVSQPATLYGGFELASSALVYILVRGNSLGTLGITQGYLDTPRVRIFDSQGRDMATDVNGRAGFNFCQGDNSLQKPVFDYYQLVRKEAPHARDACISQSLAPGVYTFSVTPTIPGSAPASGEVLFEVTLGP